MDHQLHAISGAGAVTSVGSFMAAYVTQSNIAWVVGICAGLMAIISGLASWRKDRLIITKIKKEMAEINVKTKRK